MKIGHGPATVIGDSEAAAPRVRNLREPRYAGALREKERGQAPHCLSWGFFIARTKMRTRKISFAAVALTLTSAAVHATPTPRTQMKTVVQTRDVIDEAGRHVAVPANVQRIVTLAPNLAEIVYALGAQDRLVGVSQYSDHPASVKTKPSIGAPVNPNLEAIVGAHPDLVLATAINRWETVDALAHLGIAVYTVDPHTVAGTLRSIGNIGGVIDAAPQAQHLVADLQARLDALREKLENQPPVRALFVVWDKPLISVGENTFIADAMRLAGVESVLRTKQDWPQISMEEVVKLNPDYIIYAEGDESGESADVRAAITRYLDQLRSESAWRDLSAVRDGHVAVVGEEIQVPAPGLIDTIEQLARELHPDLFALKINSHARHHAPAAFSAWQETFQEAAPCAH